jgi:hypothetical protein
VYIRYKQSDQEMLEKSYQKKLILNPGLQHFPW